MPPPTIPPISEAARVLGERIRVRRLELGKSLEDLGDDADVHWSMCGLIERGQRNASLHTLLRIAHGLELDLAVLVEALPPPPPPARRKPRHELRP
jgi:transcriptional regulator with XRE-family HTH domain